MSPPGDVLAVDGGNSKTDLVLVSADGALRALVHGSTISHQQVPIDVAMGRLTALAADARRLAATAAPPAIGAFCVAGADFASDVRLLARAIGRTGVAERVVVRNDAFAALRAGSSRGWGIAVVCGAGVNAAGVRPDGSSARLAGIGDLSGDWGGGHGLGLAALGAAVRARDGRGPATVLDRLVPAHFGVTRPIDVARRVYERRIAERRLAELAPLAFEAAACGDAVARSLVDRLADELAVMAAAVARRLGLVRRAPDVVLAGGVLRTTEERFQVRLEDRVHAAIPGARIVRLRERPVLGAALIGLDELGLPAGGPAEVRLRAELASRA